MTGHCNEWLSQQLVLQSPLATAATGSVTGRAVVPGMQEAGAGRSRLSRRTLFSNNRNVQRARPLGGLEHGDRRRSAIEQCSDHPLREPRRPSERDDRQGAKPADRLDRWRSSGRVDLHPRDGMEESAFPLCRHRSVSAEPGRWERGGPSIRRRVDTARRRLRRTGYR